MHDAGVSGLAQGDPAPLELDPDPELDDEPDEEPEDDAEPEDDPDDDEDAEPEELDPELLPELPPDEPLDPSPPDPESLLPPPASSKAVLANGSDAPPQCERSATIATMPSGGIQNRPLRTAAP